MLSDTAASARNWEHTSRENATYPYYDGEDCCVLAGTNGSLAIPTMRLKSYARDEDRSWWKPFATWTLPLERADPLERQMEHFGAVIRGAAAPLVSARDGLQNLRVTEAIVAAARSQRVVEVPID
jgi:predicted dehydrogenase